MKKWLIGSLVGAVLLFVWQFLTWSVLPIHQANYGYSANEAAIIKTLSENLTEEGQIMIPGVKPGTSNEAAQEVCKANEGKPWAIIQYHPSQKMMNMAAPMIRGFLIDVVIVLLLIYLFSNMASASFGGIFISTLMVGFISWCWFPYTGHNWFQTPMSMVRADLLDIVVGWGLLGAWLGFWLKKS